MLIRLPLCSYLRSPRLVRRNRRHLRRPIRNRRHIKRGGTTRRQTMRITFIPLQPDRIHNRNLVSTRRRRRSISPLTKAHIRLIQRNTQTSLANLRSFNRRVVPNRRPSNNHRAQQHYYRLSRHASSIIIRKPQMSLPSKDRRPFRTRIAHSTSFRLNRHILTIRRIRRILYNTRQALSPARKVINSRIPRPLMSSRRLINNANRAFTRDHHLNNSIIQPTNRHRVLILNNRPNRPNG